MYDVNFTLFCKQAKKTDALTHPEIQLESLKTVYSHYLDLLNNCKLAKARAEAQKARERAAAQKAKEAKLKAEAEKKKAEEAAKAAAAANKQVAAAQLPALNKDQA